MTEQQVEVVASAWDVRAEASLWALRQRADEFERAHLGDLTMAVQDGITALAERFCLRRVRMNDRSQFAQTDPGRHGHTDFTNHLSGVARHDGRSKDFIASLLDMEFDETIFLAVQHRAVHVLELAHVSVDFQAAAASQIPVQRVGNPDDIANSIAFFTGEAAGFVSGQVLYVAGGPLN